MLLRVAELSALRGGRDILNAREGPSVRHLERVSSGDFVGCSNTLGSRLPPRATNMLEEGERATAELADVRLVDGL